MNASFCVFRYLAIKYHEMEEKMRRQKEKGKSETTESQSVESTSQHSDDENDDDEDEISSTIVNAPQEPTIDDEGQSHNIDNAVQYDNEPLELSRINEGRHSSLTTTTIPTSKYTTTTSKAVRQQRRHQSPNSVKSKIEFEKIEVIEIKSDGSTGHLVPEHYEE